MATSIGTLTLDIVANVSSLLNGVGRAERGLNRLRDKVNEVGPAIAQGLGAAAAAGTVALVAMVKASTDAAREIDTIAKSTSVSAKALQQWDIAGATVGIENMGDVFKDVSDRVGEFLTTGAGPMKDWFETIGKQAGLTAQDFANLSGPQALQKFVAVSEEAGANTDQLSHLLQVLSGDASRLLPILRDNGAAFQDIATQAEALGLILSDREIFQLRQLSTSLTTSQTLITSMSRHVSADLAPAIQAVNQMFIDWAKSVGGVDAASNVVVTNMINGLSFVADAVDGVMRIGRAAWAVMKSGVLAVSSAVLTLYNAIIQKLMPAFAGVAELGASFGIPGAQAAADFLSGFSQGVGRLTDVVQQQAVQAANAAASAMKAIVEKPLAGTAFKRAFERAKKASDAAFAAGGGQGAGLGIPGQSLIPGVATGAAAQDPMMDPRIQKLLLYGKTKQQVLKQQYLQESNLIADQLKKQAITDAQAKSAALAAEKKYQDSMNAINNEAFQNRLSAAGNALSSLTTLMNSENRKMFEVGKAAAIAQTVISTYQGAQKAFTALADIPIVGPALGAAAAAAAIAAGMARVQSINSTEFGGGDQSAAGVSNTQAVNAASTPTAAQPASNTNIYLHGVEPGRMYDGKQIIDALNGAIEDGARIVSVSA